MNVIDLTGKRFGRLTVISRAENNKRGGTRWNCLCDCGRSTVSDGNSLRSGHSKSCGCVRNEKIARVNYKHGMCHTRLFTIWMGIKHRCSNPKFSDYSIYGGRGISVCDEWKEDFKSFYNWAISNGYSDDLSIDRIDPNGNYEPSNCRWSNAIQQANNRRNSHLVTYHGEDGPLDDMCRRLNVNSKTIRMRMRNKNITFEEAVDSFDYTSPFKEYWKKG